MGITPCGLSSQLALRPEPAASKRDHLSGTPLPFRKKKCYTAPSKARNGAEWTTNAAARAASEGLVSRTEADAILSAHANCTEPAQSTNLGGAVEIHGQGGKAGQDGSTDWTAGCVALQNEQVDALWSVLETGDTIVVLP